MLWRKSGPKENLVVRGARVLDPVQGVDAVLDVRVDEGIIAALGADLGCEVRHDIGAIADADVVYVLRMQQERMEASYVPSLREYTARWAITPERLRPGQKVMHPGPMNRGVEIDPRVADGADALVVDQVRAGLVVRMAVLYDLLTTGPVSVQAAAVHEVA